MAILMILTFSFSLSLSLSHQMLEISASMELKANSGEPMNSTDTEFADISFEELLAQEKKDSFWYAQFCMIAFSFFLCSAYIITSSHSMFRQRKSRSCSG